MVPYARLNGADGMRLSRAAFGAMLKFSEFFDTFTMLVDEVDMQWEMLQEDPERDLKLKEVVKAAPHFEGISKRWESASKMRQWIGEKKKNLIERIRKEVELEYKKKKDEEKAKEAEAKPVTTEDKPAEEKPAEEKPVEEEKKASEEEPVKVEEIIMIDTTEKPAAVVEEEKKPEEADAKGLTEADKTAIDEIADQKFMAELQVIY
jgi:hypothetical protein